MRNKTTKAKSKKLMALLMTLLIAIFAFPLAACGGGGGDGKDDGPVPEGSVRVTVNYFRPQGDYDNWNMWIWSNGAEGIAYQFKSGTVTMAGEKWKTLTADIAGVDLTKEDPIGIIVRKGNWDAKDWDGNRFIPADKIVNGRVTIYLAQGREPIYYDAQTAADAATSNTIKAAAFSSFKALYISTSINITATSHFKVYDDSDNVVAELNCAETTRYNGKDYATIKFDEAVDITKTYRIADEPAGGFDKLVNFVGRNVNMASLYVTNEFKNNYTYDGDLGVDYTAASSTFRVWTPVATALKLNVYDAGEGGNATVTEMTKGAKGVWSATIDGDLNGKYYTYTVTARGTTKEVVDPYARSAGRDGKRGMILDLDSTDPDGWATQEQPELNSYSEAVIYEAQLRDLTANPNSGVTEANRGKFLGMTETGTTVTVGSVTKSTGLDYLVELGVTAVHFQPLFDFASVKEDFNVATYNKYGEYNWGYDPLNYNVPEGSYSSDPADGSVRVNEMKEMVKALHNNGIQVIMDVVYNHVSDAQSSNFEALVPGYYFRTGPDGSYFNGSGCGNVTASERAMFRKFMIESVLYWTQEYKIDGFRFDLMGCHDIETMNMIYDALAEVNPDVIVYGEGWTGGTSGLDDEDAAIQANAAKMPNIAFFNDIIRDGLKGSVFTMTDTGFVSGKGGLDASVYVGAAGGTEALSAAMYKTIGSDKKAFAGAPTQSINYVSAHDNSTLWDKLNASVNKDEDTLKAMNRLAAASVLTSQGPAFFLAGEEMLRGKPTTATGSEDYDNRANQYLTDPTHYFSDNSYKSPDSVNAIDWTKRIENDDMIEFYKALIAIKKTAPQLQYTTLDQLNANVVFIDTDTSDGVALYGVKDEHGLLVIAVNANATKATIGLPSHEGAMCLLYGDEATTDFEGGIASKALDEGETSVELGAYSATIYYCYNANSTGWAYGVTVAEA